MRIFITRAYDNLKLASTNESSDQLRMYDDIAPNESDYSPTGDLAVHNIILRCGNRMTYISEPNVFN